MIMRYLHHFCCSVAIIDHKKLGGGGSPAFCRSLHQIGQCGSGKMRHNAAKCFITAENSLNFEKTAQKSYFVDIFKSKHSKV